MLCLFQFGSSVRAYVSPVCEPVDYIALSSSEYSQLVASSGGSAGVTLQDIFAMPLVSDWQTMWQVGFGTPIFCYLLSYLWQVLISMFTTKHD